MHWCSRHPFSACHTNHNKSNSTCAFTPMLMVQPPLCHKTVANHPESWKLCHGSDRRQTNKIESNNNDALAGRSNAKHASLRTKTLVQPPQLTSVQHPVSAHCIPSFCPKTHQNSRQLIRQSQLRCRTSMIRSSRWCGPHQTGLWLALDVRHGRYPSQNSIFAIVSRVFSMNAQRSQQYAHNMPQEPHIFSCFAINAVYIHKKALCIHLRALHISPKKQDVC